MSDLHRANLRETMLRAYVDGDTATLEKCAEIVETQTRAADEAEAALARTYNATETADEGNYL